MSFMPSKGTKVRLLDGHIATIIKVTPLGNDDRVSLDDGSEKRITTWDIAEIIGTESDAVEAPQPEERPDGDRDR